MIVLAGNLYSEKDEDPFEEGSVWDQTIVNKTWEWCIENDINPRHVENSLIRYSENFAPQAGGEPLALGNELPDKVRSKYPDFTIPDEWKRE